MITSIIGTILYLFFTLIVFGVFLNYNNYRQKRNKFINSDPTPINQAEYNDEVVIQGKAKQKDDNIIQSPLTDKECFAYEYLIEEQKGTGNTKESDWTTVEDGSQKQEFIIDDGSRVQAIVDTPNAHLMLDKEKISTEKAESNMSDGDGFFDTVEEITDDPRRYKEAVIQEGDQVTVYGNPSNNETGFENVRITDDQELVGYRLFVSDSGIEGTIDRLKTKTRNSLIGSLIFGCIWLVITFVFIQTIILPVF